MSVPKIHNLDLSAVSTNPSLRDQLVCVTGFVVALKPGQPTASGRRSPTTLTIANGSSLMQAKTWGLTDAKVGATVTVVGQVLERNYAPSNLGDSYFPALYYTTVVNELFVGGKYAGTSIKVTPNAKVFPLTGDILNLAPRAAQVTISGIIKHVEVRSIDANNTAHQATAGACSIVKVDVTLDNGLVVAVDLPDFYTAHLDLLVVGATLNVVRGVLFRANDHVAIHFEAGTTVLSTPEAETAELSMPAGKLSVPETIEQDHSSPVDATKKKRAKTGP